MATTTPPDLASQLAAEQAAHRTTKTAMGQQLVALHQQVQQHAQRITDRDLVVQQTQRQRDTYQQLVADLTLRLMDAQTTIQNLRVQIAAAAPTAPTGSTP